MNITIQNLTPRQCLFADILWQLNGRDQVDQFINSLPKKERAEATTVLNMMVAAVFDDITNTDDAARILKGF
jgi:hypothetical protein